LRRQGDPYSYCGQIARKVDVAFETDPAIPDGYGDNRCQDCLRLVREDGK
jgi:hypothetical protein